MKKTILITALAGCVAAASAQTEVRQSSSMYLPAYDKADVYVPYAISAEGKRFNPTWGLDLQWLWDKNIKMGINHMLPENIGIGRSGFRFADPLENDSELSDDMKKYVKDRSDIFTRLLGEELPLTLTADQEAYEKLNGSAGADEYFVKNKKANAEHWAAMINAHVKWIKENTKHPIAGISPFNEGDYWTVEEGATPEIQTQVAKLLKENYPLCADIPMVGGNTLNNDKAIDWYTPGKDTYTWGNTHQLAGSFKTFANFFEQMVKDGKVAYADEMHNVGEAMIGLEYGMTVGIWWGFDSRARGEFCQISRNGTRLAYQEHRDNWTAASVYRHDDGRVKAFMGSSERQAFTTTYQFLSEEREVYYDGYGPVREFRMEMPGGTAYNKGQANAERVIDITWGEDVAPGVVDGTYRIVNKATTNAIAYDELGQSVVQQAYSASNKKQQWVVTPVSSRYGGDFSVFEIESVDNRKVRMNVLNNSIDEADIIAYQQDTSTKNEHWYLEYAGDGYYYIRGRESALYLTSGGMLKTAKLIQTTRYDASDSKAKRQLWRLLPLDVKYETTAPAKPTGLTATGNGASIHLSWNANTETDVQGYNVLRAPANSSDWNVIARKLTATEFTDNTCHHNTTYQYKVRAIDKAENISAASETAEAQTTEGKHLVAWWKMSDDVNDATANMMDGKCNGKPTFTTVSERKGMRLSGNAFVQLPYNVANSEELTIAMWVNMRAADAWQRIFDFGRDTEHYMFLTPKNSYTNTMRFAIKNGGDEQVLDYKTALPTYTWKHVVITLGKEKTTMYVDGEVVASTTSINITPADVNPLMNYLGRSQFNADPMLNAILSDVRIYNFAADDNMVKQIMNGEEPMCISQTSETEKPKAIYGIDGCRRNHMEHGINIVDGKKVLK